MVDEPAAVEAETEAATSADSGDEPEPTEPTDASPPAEDPASQDDTTITQPDAEADTGADETLTDFGIGAMMLLLGIPEVERPAATDCIIAEFDAAGEVPLESDSAIFIGAARCDLLSTEFLAQLVGGATDPAISECVAETTGSFLSSLEVTEAAVLESADMPLGLESRLVDECGFTPDR